MSYPLLQTEDRRPNNVPVDRVSTNVRHRCAAHPSAIQWQLAWTVLLPVPRGTFALLSSSKIKQPCYFSHFFLLRMPNLPPSVMFPITEHCRMYWLWRVLNLRCSNSIIISSKPPPPHTRRSTTHSLLRLPVHHFFDPKGKRITI